VARNVACFVGSWGLQVIRQVDAIVFTDILHCLWRQLLGLGRDAHPVEDVATASEVTGEGTGGYSRHFGEFAFADKSAVIVNVNHKYMVYAL